MVDYVLAARVFRKASLVVALCDPTYPRCFPNTKLHFVAVARRVGGESDIQVINNLDHHEIFEPSIR